MPGRFQQNLRLLPPASVWLLGWIIIALVGGSLLMDLSGQSPADQFILARWSVGGLRIYLWLEGGLLAAVVAALGVHVVSVGFAITRQRQSSLFVNPPTLRRKLPAQAGYVFVALGAGLVALSLTTLIALNSCRYMRLI
jgi:hypothetical protein